MIGSDAERTNEVKPKEPNEHAFEGLPISRNTLDDTKWSKSTGSLPAQLASKRQWNTDLPMTVASETNFPQMVITPACDDAF